MSAPSLSPVFRLHTSTRRPDPGLAITADRAKAPMISPTWELAPWSSGTTKTGNAANKRNILREKRKLLRQSNKKSREKSRAGAALGERDWTGAADKGAEGDMAREPIQIVLLRQGTRCLLRVAVGWAWERCDDQHGCLCRCPAPRWPQRSAPSDRRVPHKSQAYRRTCGRPNRRKLEHTGRKIKRVMRPAKRPSKTQSPIQWKYTVAFLSPVYFSPFKT